MTVPAPDWARYGRGEAPQVRWSFTADAPLVAAAVIPESGQVQAADTTGGLYRLSRTGRLELLSRGFSRLRALAWSADGSRGVATIGADAISLLDARLAVEWSLQVPGEVTAAAVAPFGNWIAVALSSGTTLILDPDQQTLAHFETNSPLRFLRFLAEVPMLVGAADYGTVYAFDDRGRPLWEAAVVAGIGDLATTGAGDAIYVAVHVHGIRIFDRQGRGAGTYVVEGTPARVATSYRPHRIAVATQEHHLYWLDPWGTMLWATAVPETVVGLDCDPAGESLLCAFESGRLVCLAWEDG